MRGPFNLWRLIRTGATFERTGAMHVVLEAMSAPPRLRIAARILGWPFKLLGLKGDPALPPLTRALTALGPAYIKFGQTLATRPDVVGQELADQLRYLQDKLPPFPRAQAIEMIEQELEAPVDQLFSHVSEPVAAASIAQVHSAILTETGARVAVKVLRPHVERAFRTDVDAFYFAAGVIEWLLPSTRRLRPLDVIRHFESVVEGELDLRLEAASAAEFASNTEQDAGFSVPRPIWNLSSRRVMTLGWAEGMAMGDNAALDAVGIDRNELGVRVLTLFLRHALRDGFFHGDMHQGNLKVTTSGEIIALDFGIMGRIDPFTRRAYAEILFGFIRKDYRRVAEVHFEAGYVPPDRDIDEFARALRSVGEPIFGMDARHISMARLLAYLFEVTERFGMETRTELILLQRTMVVVEGVARSLNPEINMWHVAKPVVEEYIRESIGPKALAGDLVATARILTRFGPHLPRIVEEALIAQAHPPKRDVAQNRAGPVVWSLVGAGILGLGVVIGALI
ncbi:2-polyprenylphenol 6-hydroxylase [Roseinatronobacter monicus]|uniref:2-octaprenylphenol hydroxylase n=1 Tax=Roseinatronobacter monicus TaxID=393481 RepID=A0A543KIU1_9RHOB|nr:2-polyprenylphenol 6-hydroxylase [Roseinatronobacter monicus]TQM94986.1 2-octaprenylphenol hydroxylase [Roseinatronobacter monicus]